MLILAVDTSGRRGSVALCRGDADKFEVLAQMELEGGTYSAMLVPCISEILSKYGFAKSEIDGITLVDGPGSFTGLRVGLSTAKALCEILGKPLAAVSMLEALAIIYGEAGEQVTAVLDAGRGELYVGDYRIDEQRAELKREYIARQVDFLVELAARKSRVITTHPALADAGQHQRSAGQTTASRLHWSHRPAKADRGRYGGSFNARCQLHTAVRRRAVHAT